MDTSLHGKILDILASAKDLTIATVREDGYPQATTVSFVNDRLTIYFGCAEESQKAKNIARNNKVSVTVNNDYASWEDIQGLSMGAVAERVTEPSETARIGELMLAKFPQIQAYLTPAAPAFAFYRVTPVVISVLDYTKGFGHTDLILL